jgi:hypothetical protein
MVSCSMSEDGHNIEDYYFMFMKPHKLEWMQAWITVGSIGAGDHLPRLFSYRALYRIVIHTFRQV